MPTARSPGVRRVPVSFVQRRFWHMQQLEGTTSAYNVSVVLHLHGQLNCDALAKALGTIVKRHEILRTAFPVEEGEPVQEIHPDASIDLVIDDLAGLPPDERDRRTNQCVEAETARPFDLSRAPLARARLVRLAKAEHLLVLVIHHMAIDAWSVAVLLRELGALYRSFAAGERSPLPDLALQYADYTLWQRDEVLGTALRRQLDYWTRRLAGAPVLDLPTDGVRDGAVSRDAGRETVVLSNALVASLRALSRRERATLFMVLMAAVKILLARWTGQEEVVVGFPVAGRTRPQFEPLIGCFLNTLPLRTDLAGNPTFRELLARVRDGALEAYDHQALPFQRLVEELRPERVAHRHPVFDVLFNFAPFPDLPEVPGVTVTRWWTERDTKYLMTLYAREHGDALALSLVYQRGLLAPERMAAFARQLAYLLQQIVADPGARIGDYSLLTPECRSRLPDPTLALREPRYDPVPLVLERQTALTPEAVAVRRGSYVWTYQALMQSARAIALALLGRGLRQGDVVAVAGPRSFGLMSSFAGVLASGAVLLPLDRTLPAARRQLVLREARAKYLVVVGDEPPADVSLADFPAAARLTVSPSAGSLRDPGPAESLTLPELHPDQPAYIFFTSGTSGVPKAVLGCHKGLSHFLAWQRETFAITARDRVAQLTGLSFDVLLRDVFLPLTSGGSICLPERDDLVEPGYVLPWLAHAGVTVLHTVPTLAESWLAANAGIRVPALRCAFFAGEPLSDSLVRRWRAAVSPAAEVVNLYGPTETTLVKCWHRVPDPPKPGMQLAGRALPETQALVVSEGWRLCGVAEVGEIVLRTPFRTLGYLNDVEEQLRRFQPSPFTGEQRDLLYRTGDSGRYEPDGSLVVAGRLDDQVKIRGCRVEPGETAAVLGAHPAVRQAVVVPRVDRTGERALVAYVVAHGSPTPTSDELRRFLEARLPAYMVPSLFVAMEAFPLTPSGKVDRNALPLPPLTPSTPDDHVPPRTSIEAALAEVWADLLGCDRVGVHDSFFDLGGHSLMATQLAARVRNTLGVEISLRDVFTRPTVAELADAIVKRGGAGSTLWVGAGEG